MNSEDASQIAARHTGELVKEAAERITEACLSAEGPDKHISAPKIDVHPVQMGSGM